MAVCNINGVGRGSGREISDHTTEQVKANEANEGWAGKLSVNVE